MRKIAMLLVIIVMLVCFVGCSGNTSNDATTGRVSQTTTKTTNSESTGEESYIIEILREAGSYKEYSNETVIGQYIEDEFGIVFKYISYSGDMREKQTLMLASGDYNEMQYMQRNDMVQSYISAGVLLSLEPYLADMPNFTARFANHIGYWRIPGAGTLYKWEFATPYTKGSHLDIMVRGDILEQNNWEYPVSTDDYVAFLKKGLAANPTTPDGQATVGMTGPFAESWGLAGIVPILYEKGDTYTSVGNEGVIFNLKTQQFGDYFQNEAVKESFQFFNTLYREGLLDEECFTDTADKTLEKVQQGRALASWYTVWNISSANEALIANGQENLQYVSIPVQSNTQVEQGQKRQLKVETTGPFQSVGLTNKCKDPARIMKLLDWAASEEGQIILQSGFIDKCYTVENGKRVPTQFYLDTKRSTEASYEYGFGEISLIPSFSQAKAEDGQFYDLMEESAIQDQYGLTDRQKEIYEKIGWTSSETWYDLNGKLEETGLSSSVNLDPTTDIGKLQTQMTETRVKYTAKLILAETEDEFESIYQEAMAEYDKINHQSVVDEYNKKLKDLAGVLDQYKYK